MEIPQALCFSGYVPEFFSLIILFPSYFQRLSKLGAIPI